jgi:CDP-paratose synthetase
MTNVKTILVTGATGFLGSHLIESLIKQGYSVVILKRSTSNLWRISDLMPLVKSYDVDLVSVDLAFMENRIDCVIHAACHYGRNGDSAATIAETNLSFGLCILDACLKHGTSTFVNTDTLLSKYLNNYTLSKKQFVEWLTQHSDKINVINLRLEHIYGPKDDKNKFVHWVISQFEANVPEISLTKGHQKRDFIYIDDVVAAYLLVIEKSSALNGFNEYDVGTGKLMEVKVFLELLKDAYQNNLGNTTSKLLFGAVPYRDGEMMTVKVDNESLVALGWKPVISVKQGLQNLIKGYS